MHWTAGVTLIAFLATAAVVAADEGVTFKNRKGVHTLKVKDGVIYHTLDSGVLGSVNDETATATAGNQVTGVVAVAGSGFADLDDIHVVAVDKLGVIWHTARLPDGTWLRWGKVTDEIGYSGKAVSIKCSSRGRKLKIVARDAAGVEIACYRDADGTWLSK